MNEDNKFDVTLAQEKLKAEADSLREKLKYMMLNDAKSREQVERLFNLIERKIRMATQMKHKSIPIPVQDLMTLHLFSQVTFLEITATA